jgi:hypothetical protein
MRRGDLKAPILEALLALGGKAKIADVCKYVWEHHERDLRASGKYFYVWQYELRWASDILVKNGKIEKGVPRGVWKLTR